jgi:catechol 2,3-dioxygenase-like lactoylglutathione lyase family enzyme
MTRFRHLALFVEDLREAEEHYVRVFDMEVLFREAPLEAGGAQAELWATLPLDRNWEDAAAAGIELGMVALRRDDCILALFGGKPAGNQVFAVGLVMGKEEIEGVAGQLSPASVETKEDGWLAFVDHYGMRWHLADRAEFRSNGEAYDRWLDFD